MRNTMRKVAMSLIIAAGFASLLMLGTAPVAQAQDTSENTPPVAWTQKVCEGAAAIVFQGEPQEGDGVTVKVTDAEQCPKANAWYLVEPWSAKEMNPDAGCVAASWGELQATMTRGGWVNGSGWVVNYDELSKHPLVVKCSQVTSGASLGLNPNEEQVKITRLLLWVMPRARALLSAKNLTIQSYCAGNTEKLATDIICPLVIP